MREALYLSVCLEKRPSHKGAQMQRHGGAKGLATVGLKGGGCSVGPARAPERSPGKGDQRDAPASENPREETEGAPP